MPVTSGAGGWVSAAAGEGAGCQWRQPRLLIGQPRETEVARCALWAWEALPYSSENERWTGSVGSLKPWIAQYLVRCQLPKDGAIGRRGAGIGTSIRLPALAARKASALPRPGSNLAAAQARQGGPAARHEQAGRASPPCRPASPRSLPQLAAGALGISIGPQPRPWRASVRADAPDLRERCSRALSGAMCGMARRCAALRGRCSARTRSRPAAAAPARLPRALRSCLPRLRSTTAAASSRR